MNNLISNLDILTVGIAVAATGILGFTVFFSDRKSITNRSFLDFSLVTMFWGIVNYLNYNVEGYNLTLWAIRSVLFFAVFQAFYFFSLMYVFPKADFKFPRWYKTALVPVVIITAFFSLTPFVFSGIEKASLGTISQPIVEPGIIVFAVVALGLVLFGILSIIEKAKLATGFQRKQFNYLLYGIGIMFALIICFNFLFPTVIKDSRFISLSALFTFPFILFTFYAIYKHKLFNLKVAAIAVAAFILTIYSFLNIVYAETSPQKVTNITYLALVIIGSIFLIKSVLKEISQRERIEAQEKELEKVNIQLSAANARLRELDKQKSEFVSFASHQLRSPLTAIKGYASLILEGDYGAVSADLKKAAQIIFDSTNTLATVVSDYLNLTRIELGQMSYNMKEFDLKKLVEEVAAELRPNLEAAALDFNLTIKDGDDYTVNADHEKIKQVFANLIDNSAKYAPRGKINVELGRHSGSGGSTFLFSVKDSGIGISKGALPKLFGKFTRAKNANEVNIRGTGLGLFIAKEIVMAHKGKIWVESEGEGKGSQFYVELPAGS